MSLMSDYCDLDLLVAIGQQDVRAIAYGVVVQSAIERVDSLGTNVAP